MAITPEMTPGYGDMSVSGADRQGGSAGQGKGGDPAGEPGQYPASLFGVALPQGTGAPGSGGASGSADPSNEPGQLNEGISGLGPADTSDTGAPGSQGAQNTLGGGPDRIVFTRPGAFLTSTNTQNVVNDNISGPNDWTQANDGSYAGGGPQLPGIKGNEPTSTGAGQGRVLRGGRRVR